MASTDIAIQIRDLGKRYRIGERIDTHRTLREALSTHLAARLRAWTGGKGTAPPQPGGGKRTIWALRHVSFDVHRGEVVGVIGPNGAGKSTLLKVLASITKPTEGEVLLYGQVGALLEVGTGFHPELTGRENIFLNGAILGMNRREILRKLEDIVAFAEIERFIDTPVKHYSSGMYMRLAFSVAAHLDPEILLVDEVLAVGDAAFQKKCLHKMEDVAGEGRTVLFVSHNLAAVQNLCSRTVLFERGQAAQIGPTEAVISHYLAEIAPAESAEVRLQPLNGAAPGTGRRLLTRRRSGRLASQFRLGEPWQIVLEFEVRRPIPSVVAAVQLVNLRGISLITFESPPRDLDRGQYAVTFDCDVALRPDHMQFNVFLSAGDEAFYTALGAGHIQISPVVSPENKVRVHGQNILAHTPQGEIVALAPELEPRWS